MMRCVDPLSCEMLRGPILCATDLSDAADAALRQAHAIARQLDVPLHVAHVLDEAFNVHVLFPHLAGLDPARHGELTRVATAAVRTRLDDVLGAGANTIPLEIETGTPHAGILAVADRLGVGLIVAGPGRSALHVARAATAPVLIARPSPEGGVVLAATDLSDPSLPAVRMAAAEARRRGVRGQVIHCLDLDSPAYVAGAGLAGAPAWPLPQPVVDQLESTALRDLAAALERAGADGVDPVVSRSSPVVGILAAAEAVPTALVVVGTRGRTGLARLALGSVAEAIIGRAPCSVLTVPLHPA
jgi:nucleotide-binding universal stress UspA family protein